jgi:hypothetical protein
MSLQEALLHAGREWLREARAERSSWRRFDSVVNRDDAGHEEDTHAPHRQQVAWALQYQPGGAPGDAELLRYLLEQEVAWRRAAPFQGIGEALEILAWLVARERHVEDVWLLAQAKQANFDCACGFDREHLVTGGVDATLAHVRASQRPERDAVLLLLLDESGAPSFEELEILQWLQRKAAAYPTAPEQEPLECWIDRALEIGNHEIAKQLIAQWRETRECDCETLTMLSQYFAALGEHGDEADARTTLLAYLSTPFERAGELCRAAAAERRAGLWARAIDHLDHAALLHRVRVAWRELGLGRDLVHEAFALAEVAADEIARHAFTMAEEFTAQTPRLPLTTLELAARAAARLGTGNLSTYQARAEAERAAISAGG